MGWSDRKRWWMDLLKFLVTFSLGAVVTYMVVDRLDERRMRQRYLSETQFELRLTAADDLREATLDYLDAAQDAYLEMARTSETDAFERTAPMRRYEDETWVELRAAIERVRTRFTSAEIRRCLDRFEEENRDRHGIYQEAWIGWVQAGDPADRWRVGGDRRSDYDQALAAVMEHRGRCLALMERELAAGPPG